MGKQQFHRATTVESLSNLRYVRADLNIDGPLPPGTDIVEYFYAPEGKFCEVTSFYFNASVIPGATSGTQNFYLGRTNHAGLHFMGRSTFNTMLQYLGCRFSSANDYQAPPEVLAQTVFGQPFDSVEPLRLQYVNDTDAQKNDYVAIKIYYKEQSIV